MTDQTKKGWLIPILTSIITSLAVVAGAWFSLQGSVQSSTAEAESIRLESAFKRIEHLEKQMNEQQATSSAKIVELTSQVFRLQTQLNKNLDIDNLFEEFMEALPFEAWVKEVDKKENGDVVFRMKSLNKRYQFTFGITQSRYEGSTDYKIWPEEIANQFRANDLAVYNSKASSVVREYYPKDYGILSGLKSPEKRYVLKMYLELIDGEPLIFGMILDLPNNNE